MNLADTLGDQGSRPTRDSGQPWVSRVYIIDDHRFFTFALTSLINSQADLAVCGSSSEQAVAEAEVAKLNPDVVVMDVKLSAADGLAIAKAIRSVSRTIPIIFVSSLQNPQFELDSKWLAPCSFVEKTRDPADIIASIRQTLAKIRDYQRSLHPNPPAPKT